MPEHIDSVYSTWSIDMYNFEFIRAYLWSSIFWLREANEQFRIGLMWLSLNTSSASSEKKNKLRNKLRIAKYIRFNRTKRWELFSLHTSVFACQFSRKVIQSNLAIRNGLIRNILVLRNHFLWPICHLLHKD